MKPREQWNSYVAVYALNGDMNQISKYIFIFSPAGVDIMGDIVMDDGTIPTFNNNF